MALRDEEIFHRLKTDPALTRKKGVGRSGVVFKDSGPGSGVFENDSRRVNTVSAAGR
jgi:predicted nucleic acid-binding Zn ribbon protein